MNDWKRAVEQALDERVENFTPVSSGDMSTAFKFSTAANTYFAKYSAEPIGNFHEEAASLSAIRELDAIPTPDVIEVSDHLLLLQWIEPGGPRKSFWTRLGTGLAALHKHGQKNFGFKGDNHIGSTKQANPLRSVREISWTEYFMEFRLKAMLHHPTLSHDALFQATFVKTEKAMRQALDRVDEPPSLVHGDLWSGNFLCGPDQTAYLIDPAVYFGHREVDIAMSELFGGFDVEFYRAYGKEFPLSEDYKTRKNIYNLYHLMNHWILFGESYRALALKALAQV